MTSCLLVSVRLTDSGLTKGLLSVASHSFLIPITQRQQVAQIQGKPIYTITDVAVIPTSSRADAIRAIAQAKEHLAQGDISHDETTSEEGISDAETEGGDTEVNSAPPSPVRETFHSRGRSFNSIAEDVIGKKVRFGRFAANWLSRKTLGLPGLGTVNQDMPKAVAEDDPLEDTGSNLSTPNTNDKASAPVPSDTAALSEPPGEWSPSSPMVQFLPKLLKYTRLLFASHNFFFAYDYDLTRHMSTQESFLKDPLPLHKAVDELVRFCLTAGSPIGADLSIGSISGISIS